MDASTIQQGESNVAALNSINDVTTAFINTHRFISCTEAAINRALSRCGHQAHFIENSEYLQFGGCVKHIRGIPPGAHIVSHTKGLRDGVEVDFITYYMLAEIGTVEVWYWNTAGNKWYPSILELRDITNAGYPNSYGGTVLFYALPEGC